MRFNYEMANKLTLVIHIYKIHIIICFEILEEHLFLILLLIFIIKYNRSKSIGTYLYLSKRLYQQ